MLRILICNGSLGGANGNTNVVIEHVLKLLKARNCTYETLELNDLLKKKISPTDVKEKFQQAAGVIFTSGTYWDSWGSPLQNFLEVTTEFEGSDIFLGKPAAVFITMHSVGGKGVLSRLQGVLNTLGFLIPPMSGLVYSLAGHLALQTESSFSDDFWSLEDAETVVHNFVMSLNNETNFKAWAIDHKDPKRLWIK